MSSGPSMMRPTKAAYIAHSIRRFVSIGLTTLQGKQALWLENDDCDDDAEHDGPCQDVVSGGSDQSLDLTEEPGGKHRAEQAADATHDHHEEAVDDHRRTHVGKYRLEATHHHTGDAC